jgi:hypothetical protein
VANKLYFYFIRFKKSSLPEILNRTREFLFLKTLKIAPVFFLRNLKAPEVTPEALKQIKLPPIFGEIDDKTINSILAGHCFCLNHDHSPIKSFEKKWKKTFFTEISIKSDVPDIRAVWEPARLQHLLIVLHKISEAWDNVELKDFVRSNILEWIKHNKFLHGPHYISVMECGHRIPVFLFALRVLDNLKENERRLILQTVFEHAWIIEKRLSLFSSLGNHTVVECMGLVIAGCIFSNSKEGRRWLKTGICILEKEVNHQVLDDGGPIEQSFQYHRFVIDLYLCVVSFLEDNNLYDCSGIKKRIKKGEEFLSAFKGNENESMLFIGDSDDGYAIAPGIYPVRPNFSGGKKEYIRTFPDSGYTVIRINGGFRLIFDHGPLGMAPLYNHGHADALSITLYLDDVPFLVDPGTYRYNGSKEKRAYFKGTRAHNTVNIDGKDQARQLTGFIWEDSYNVDFSKSTSSDCKMTIQATHDGYTKLTPPVLHTRELAFNEEDVFIIKDSFKGNGQNDFELNFHLHPDVDINIEDEFTILESSGKKIFIKLVGSQFSIVKGQESPLMGWYSAGYGLIEPTSVLQSKVNGFAESTKFTTIISTKPPI